MILVNLLSMRVALCVVILVGRVTEGLRPILYNELINSVVALCSCGISKSLLKSPQTKTFFLLLILLYSSENFSLNVLIQDQGFLYMQLTNMFFYFSISISAMMHSMILSITNDLLLEDLLL